jgi:apolipoprotein N-acyltransferase
LAKGKKGNGIDILAGMSRSSHISKRIRPWGFAVGAGIISALALPDVGWWTLLLVFPGSFLEALRDRPKLSRTALIGLVAGTTHWIFTVRWVVPVMNHYGGLPLAGAIVCLFFMALILAAGWAVIAAITSRVSSRAQVFLFPAVWALMEALRQFPPYEFPWNVTAAAFVEIPALLQSLPIWGATGFGWAVMTVGAGLWATLRPSTRRIGVFSITSAAALILVFSLASSRFSPSGDPVKIAVLQPGTSLEERWDPNNWEIIAANVWAMSQAAAQEGSEILLWPESAVPFRLDSQPVFRDDVIDLASRLECQIVLNSVATDPDETIANAAYAVSSDGVDSFRYNKIQLVPFGEYVPVWARFAFTEALVREVGSFSPGTSYKPLNTRPPLGIAVCYEIVFADLVARQVRSGAAIVATITNDGWYGFSSAPSQHFAQAVLRAVESRRWVARAALTGISGFVNPSGKSTTLGTGETGFLVDDVVPSTALTPRVRFGDWWVWVCLVVVISTVALDRRNRLRGAQERLRVKS